MYKARLQDIMCKRIDIYEIPQCIVVPQKVESIYVFRNIYEYIYSCNNHQLKRGYEFEKARSCVQEDLRGERKGEMLPLYYNLKIKQSKT